MARPTIDEVAAEPAGNRLDRWVAERVMGIEVLGEAACTAEDGCWAVWLGTRTAPTYTDADGAVRVQDHGAYVRPVYQDGEDLWADDSFFKERLAGRSQLCLKPVPWYSTDWADARRVVDRVAGRLTGEAMTAKLWRGPDGSDHWTVDFGGLFWTGDTFPLAVCRAAVIRAIVAAARPPA